MYISLWENSRGHPDNVSFMQFSTKIDGFEQKDSQGFENSYNSYEQYPLEKLFIFTIYQNYTLALMSGALKVLLVLHLSCRVLQSIDIKPFTLKMILRIITIMYLSVISSVKCAYNNSIFVWLVVVNWYNYRKIVLNVFSRHKLMALK